MKDSSLNRVERLFLHRSFVYLLSILGALLVMALLLPIYLAAVRVFNLDPKVFSMLFGAGGSCLAALYIWGISEIAYRIRRKRLAPFLNSMHAAIDQAFDESSLNPAHPGRHLKP
jgi:hypothetical protein